MDAFRKALLDIGRPGMRDCALRREADREQWLDHVIVQVAGDTVAVGQDLDFLELALALS